MVHYSRVVYLIAVDKYSLCGENATHTLSIHFSDRQFNLMRSQVYSRSPNPLRPESLFWKQAIDPVQHLIVLFLGHSPDDPALEVCGSTIRELVS